MVSKKSKKITVWDKFKKELSNPEPIKKITEIRLKKLKKRKKMERERRRLLKHSLIRAGIETKPEFISRLIFKLSFLFNFFIAILLVKHYASYFTFVDAFYVPVFLLATWLAAFLLVFFLLWLSFYLTFDFLSYKRKVDVEEVLPDFLLLASANIRAGMPIDRALWYAVRPRFGVLAKEIEFVAKETMSGEDLEEALRKFADKYNSPMLRNTVNLIIEGINAGGELGGLLHNISVSIQDNKRLRKEMAASISAYAIFITASALIIAPLMFALSSQLLEVISDITGNLNLPEAGLTTFAFATGGISITQNDFLKFAFTNLFFTSLISAMIVSIIRKGNIKAGLKYIPIFVTVSLLVFYGAFKLFGGVFGDII